MLLAWTIPPRLMLGLTACMVLALMSYCAALGWCAVCSCALPRSCACCSHGAPGWRAAQAAGCPGTRAGCRPIEQPFPRWRRRIVELSRCSCKRCAVRRARMCLRFGIARCCARRHCAGFVLLMLGYRVTVRGWQHVAPARSAGAVTAQPHMCWLHACRMQLRPTRQPGGLAWGQPSAGSPARQTRLTRRPRRWGCSTTSPGWTRS